MSYGVLSFMVSAGGALVRDIAYNVGRVIGAALAGYDDSVNVRGDRK